MRKIALMTAAAAAGLALASSCSATALTFSGTFANSNPPAALGGRCSGLTVTIGNAAPFFATGTSNLGAFTASQSHCLDAGPPLAIGAPDTPYYNGLFSYNFASGDTLSGSYTGVLSNAGIAGVVNNTQNFVVSGGTGIFANATGSFLGLGQIHFAGGPPSATLTISRGVINTSAVPEPSTWLMLMLGFGVIAAGVRGRRQLAAA